jgi:hypothetical protein
MKPLLLIPLLLLSGCLSFYSQPAGIQPEAFTLQGRSYEVLGDAEGYSSSFTFFWIIPFGRAASLEDAVADAIRSKGGDNLIEMNVYKERDVYITGTINAVRVTGRVIKYTNTVR